MLPVSCISVVCLHEAFSFALLCCWVFNGPFRSCQCRYDTACAYQPMMCRIRKKRLVFSMPQFCAQLFLDPFFLARKKRTMSSRGSTGKDDCVLSSLYETTQLACMAHRASVSLPPTMRLYHAGRVTGCKNPFGPTSQVIPVINRLSRLTFPTKVIVLGWVSSPIFHSHIPLLVA